MFKVFFVLMSLLLWSGSALAAHPLITDDTGTQGRGKFQLEVNGEYADDNGNTVTELAVTVSAGITEKLDLVVGMPYQFLRTEVENSAGKTDSGISDASVEMKWRLYEKDGLSFALKPGVAFPTGNDNKGLGDGSASYSLFFITTKEMEFINIHFNLGYIKNRTELQDILHYSIAGEYRPMKDLRIVANIGGETNPEKQSNVHPLFILGGLIYSLTENIDMDFGIKTGLNKAEADYAMLVGLAYRF